MPDSYSRNKTSFNLPPLYAIVNHSSEAGTLRHTASLLAAGVRLLQLRAKNISPAALLQLARKLAEICRESCYDKPAPPVLVINDYPEICAEAGACGIHLGQTDGSPAKARALLGPSAIIGQSTHNIEQLCAAPAEFLNYLALGPIFLSPTKQGHAPQVGLETLKKAASLSPLPLVAIGGINLENAEQVYAAGANSVALISDLENTVDLPLRVRSYYQIYASTRRP